MSCASSPPPAPPSNLEKPSFKVKKTKDLGDGSVYELRCYEPYIVAATTVQADDLDDASSKGFRILAGYIFGDNQGENKIAMTAPVQSKPAKIEMTAPVATTQNDEGWEITFMMPSKYTMETLPKPNDSRVRFEEIEKQCRAVLSFSGTTPQKVVDAQSAKLKSMLKSENLEATSSVELARYNDPFTFPWNRLNEVMVNVDEGTDS